MDLFNRTVERKAVTMKENQKMSALKLKWTGDSKGSGEFVRESDNEKLNIAIPTASGGSGEGFAPRDLLGSSAGACLALTLVSLMDVRKLPVTDFSMETKVTKKDDTYSITHYPKISLSSEATEKEQEGVERAVVSADKRCTIGNVLKEAGVKITIEPSLTIG
jgi:peroxiredoxin-like protein